MMKPDEATFNVGKTKHGAPVQVNFRDGVFSISTLAMCQRDTADRVFGLTRENLLAIGRVAEVVKDWPA